MNPSVTETTGLCRVYQAQDQVGSACYRNEQQPSAHRRAASRSPAIARNEAADPAVLAASLTACIRELQETLQEVRKPPSPAYDFQDSAVSIAVDTPEGTAGATPAPSEDDHRSRQSGTYTHALSSPKSAAVEDAATILEFLAWGRRKVSTYDEHLVSSDTNSRPSRFSGDVALDQDPATDPAASQLQLSDESSLSLLQLLLPQKRSTVSIVKYHCECLLWYHGSFHGLVFRKELDMFLRSHQGLIDRPGVDLQWVALLFAVLPGSMTCAPRIVASSWGFEDQERAMMAQRWFKAALICLNRANYTAYHSIYAVQCPPPPHSRAEGSSAERSNITAINNDNSNRYDRVGIHGDASGDGDRLALDIHRLVVQAFYEQEVVSQRGSSGRRDSFYQQNGAGQRQRSDLVSSLPSLTFQDNNNHNKNNNNWLGPGSAQDDYAAGEHSTLLSASVRPLDFLRRYPNSTEDPAAGNGLGVQSRFAMSDSLEDISQNGGPG